VAVAAGFLVVPDARENLAPYLVLFAAGAAVSLAAARILTASGPGFLLFCGAILRLTLLARAPDLSDDAYRYLWDGGLAARGISPYAFAPNDPRLAGIASPLSPRVAHRDVRTVYPPVAQAAFRVFGGAGHLIAWKAFVAAADLSVVALLRASGGEAAGFAAALYAFHPLPVTESAGEGHFDSLGVALLLAGLLHLGRGRRATAGIAFALSVLTKLVSLAAAIPLLRGGRSRFLAGASVTAVALWIAAFRPGASPAGGLGQYATRWDFNSPSYTSAVRLMEVTAIPERAKAAFLGLKERLHHPRWTESLFPYFYPAFFARAGLGGLLDVLLLAVGTRVKALENAVFWSLAALLLLSPTLYPWYLLWLLPLAAKKRDPAFLFLSFSIPLSYALLYPLPGVSPTILLVAEYLPFYALLLGTTWRRAPTGERS
jgi:hypothetical protein